MLGQRDIVEFVLFIPCVADIGEYGSVDVAQGKGNRPGEGKFLDERESEFGVEHREFGSDQIEVVPSSEGNYDL